jgi:transposase-like protein
VFFANSVGKFLLTTAARSFRVEEKRSESLPSLKKENGIGLAEFKRKIRKSFFRLTVKGVVMAKQPNKFKCHSCGRSFSSEDQLREHEKTVRAPVHTAASTGQTFQHEPFGYG